MRALQTPLHARLAGAVVGVMALEGILFGSWIVVAVAAGAAALDALGARSPFARAAGLVQRIAYPMRPMAPARAAALARAGVLSAAAIVLALGAPEPVGAVVAAPAVLDALLDALTGWCPACAIARRARGRGAVEHGARPGVVVIGGSAYPPSAAIVDAIRRMGVRVSEVELETDGRWAWRARRLPAVLVLDEQALVVARLEAPTGPEPVRAFLAAADVTREA